MGRDAGGRHELPAAEGRREGALRNRRARRAALGGKGVGEGGLGHLAPGRAKAARSGAERGSEAAERNLNRITFVFALVWVFSVLALSFLLVR